MKDSRIPETPPMIQPLAENGVRPLWSVMIPAFNCTPYLQDALESVLAQDPGADKMQIEVVDDCSTDGDVESLVMQIGKGRVGYFRQEVNRGSLRNFETCLNRARGRWVHLLHGDDKVKDGFYLEVQMLFHRFPDAGAAITSHLYMDASGKEYTKIRSASDGIADEPGILHNWLSVIAQRNRLQPPAVVVKRSVYEQVGGFFAVHFGEDWEMWVRIASRFPCVYSPKRLAVYREHTLNITTRSFLSGQNIRDITKVIDIIQGYLPQQEKRKLKRQATKNASRYILRTARKVLYRYHRPQVALVQARGALKLHPTVHTLYQVGKLYIKCLLFSLKRRLSHASSNIE